MKIHVAQFYVEPGAVYSFTHAFQVWMGQELTKRVRISDEFIKTYSEDFEVIFRISAKRSLKDPEMKGPTVYRKSKDIEFTIFLPFNRAPREITDFRQPLNAMLGSIASALGQIKIDSSELVKESQSIVKAVLTNSGMIELPVPGVNSERFRLQTDNGDRQINEGFFAMVRSKAAWRIDGECLWSFFFTSTEKSKIQTAAVALEKMGYDTSEFTEDREAGAHMHFYLKAEKKEAHTPRTLEVRNTELTRFAQEFDLESYDGMEVGPA